MSKKIVIPSDNIRYKLVDLFHSFLSHYKKRSTDSHCRTMYDWFGEDMDDDEIAYWRSQGFIFDDAYEDDDDDELLYPINFKGKKKKDRDIYSDFWDNKVKKKKHKRGSRGRHARLIDLSTPYSGHEDNPYEVGDGDYDIYTDYEEIDDNGISNGKEIYYYPDYHDKENRLVFETLSGFCNFCEENGYVVPDHIANDIMYRRVSHCCLVPESKTYGMYEIMAEESYGTMFYEVCESSELDG